MEKIGPELYIPPKGSSIIPALPTENLLRWSTLNPRNLVGAMGGGNGTNISINHLSLPNVSDANSFVSELRNFTNYAIQRESNRK